MTATFLGDLMGVEVSILLRDLTQTSVDTNTPLLL